VPILDAAIEGSKLRLRPIRYLLRFYSCCVSTDAGVRLRRCVAEHHGKGVVFGMTIATAVGLFIIPVCYVFVQRIVDMGRTAVASQGAVPAFPVLWRLMHEACRHIQRYAADLRSLGCDSHHLRLPCLRLHRRPELQTTPRDNRRISPAASDTNTVSTSSIAPLTRLVGMFKTRIDELHRGGSN